MKRAYIAAIVIGLFAHAAAAQDAKTVIANASKAIGADSVTSITYYGQAANFNLGQNNNANGPWPRTNVDDYRRSIDFSQPALRATGQTYAAPVQGGPPVQGNFQQLATPANTGWAQHLDVWVSPWGFLKGAAANNATARAQTVSGTRYNVVTWNTPQKAPSGIPYKVVGYINAQTNMVDKVETWLENPIFGDMLVETRYSLWREAQNNSAVKFPAGIVQERGGFPTFEAQLLSAEVNPANIQALLTPPPPPAGRGGGPGGPGGPGAPGGAPAPVVSQSEKLADGVYRIFGGYNAVAVEFADHILLFEGAVQNEARAAANIAEVKRVIPNKPIRYAVISHHHFDHTSGIAATVAEGARIVSHESNVALLQRGLAAPRTLAPDAMSKSGKKPIFDPVVGDMRVFEDATRRVELHVMKGLPHADGMLMLYLPKEKIMAYADTYNAPPAGQVAPRIVAVDVMMANVRRVGMDFTRVVSVHAPNPDRPITKAEIEASLAATGTP
jgi:glyoxylase-like metal-dependent hydrolase (beta-lactamase superfamily II)